MFCVWIIISFVAFTPVHTVTRATPMKETIFFSSSIMSNNFLYMFLITIVYVILLENIVMLCFL